MGALSAQAAAGPHHTAFMEATACVWTMTVPCIVLEFARDGDMNATGGPFQVLLHFYKAAHRYPVGIITAVREQPASYYTKPRI